MWAAIGAAVAVAAAVFAIGVTNDDDGGELTLAPADLALDDLQPALLTVEDVGLEYAESSSSDDDDDEMSTDDIQMSSECRAIFDRLAATGSDDDALQAEFERTVDDASLSHELMLIDEQFPSFGEIHDILEQCGTMPFDDGETSGEIRLHTESVDGPGEDAMAIIMEIDLSAGGFQVSLEGYGISFAHGGVMSTVMATSGLDQQTLEATAVDRDLVRQLAELSDQRVQDALSA